MMKFSYCTVLYLFYAGLPFTWVGVKKADRVESESEKQSHLFFLPSPFPSPPIKHGEATTGRGENSSVMKGYLFFCWVIRDAESSPSQPACLQRFSEVQSYLFRKPPIKTLTYSVRSS
jgi:hypothetical protein